MNSGNTARLISKYRPLCPIIMITRNATASRVSPPLPLAPSTNTPQQYSHLYRGVYPFFFPEAKPDFSKADWQEDVDKRLKWGISEAKALGILSHGDNVVCVQGWKGGMGHTNTFRIVPATQTLGLADV